jgi:hypothetical protein
VDEMVGTCSGHEGHEKRMHDFLLENPERKNYLGELAVNGRIILKLILKNYIMCL